MPILTTPGVYVERATPRPLPALGRTDVAGFVGIAERGPIDRPVRLTSWREFRDAFGGLLPYAHLAYAVRAFFENGGGACWVVRIADAQRARTARAALAAAGSETADPDAAVPAAYRVAATSPGSWGNRLAVRALPAQLASARQDPTVAVVDPSRLAVDTVAGFAVGSVVRLGQRGTAETLERRVVEVDPLRRMLRFSGDLGLPLDPLDAARPILVSSLELTLLVLEDGQVVERLEGLAPAADHPRDAVARVAAISRRIRLERTGADCRIDGESGPTCALPAVATGRDVALAGGKDALATLSVFDHVGTPAGEVRGLAALEAVDEVSILALPDLAARARRLRKAPPAPPLPIDPCAPGVGELATVEGVVHDAESGTPLVGVAVDDGRGGGVVTDGDGRFALPGWPAGSAFDLLFTLDGWDDLRLRVDVDPAVADGLAVTLVRLDLPAALGDEDVFFAQQAAVSQCERLRDRIAVLEAPFVDAPETPAGGASATSGDQLTDALAWRERFASAYAALYHPWLRVRDPLEPDAARGRAVPPCGHVVGLMAALDRAEGVHRPPANRTLAWVEDVTAAIDDIGHGLLNPNGVNALRALPGRGIRVLGARTLAPPGAGALIYVNVRRLLNALIEAIEDGLAWAVFEPNDTGLRLAVQQWLIGLADGLWRRGALAGGRAEEAFRVTVDDTTTLADDVAEGRLIGLLEVAPVVPYEFVVVRLGLSTDELAVAEVET